METSGTILDLEPSWSLLHELATCCLEVEHPWITLPAVRNLPTSKLRFRLHGRVFVR
jgi:hypothetical protein